MSGWSCRTYYNVNPFIGCSWHDTVGPIPAPPFMGPVKLPHIGFSVVQGLWLGSFLSNGRDKEVISEDLLFIGRMSDAGLGIPHISIPPSWLNILTSLFASSNSVFGASSVTIACKNLIWGNEDCDIAVTPFGKVPLSLNLGCFDPISLPTDIVVVWGSVFVGVTWADILAAAIDIALTIAMDVVMLVGGKVLKKALGKLGKKLFGKSSKKVAKEVTEEVADQVGDSAGDRVARNVGVQFVDEGADEIGEQVGKEASQSAFKKKWKSLKRGVMQAAGEAPTDEYKTYMRKAAQVQAIADGLDMDNIDLKKFVSADDLGADKHFRKVVGGLDDGMDKWTNKYGKYVKNLDDYSEHGARQVDAERVALKQLDPSIDDVAADFATKQTVLKDALQELKDAYKSVKLGESLWEVEWKGLKRSFSKIIGKHGIMYSNVLGDGTEGGVLSFEGLGWTNFFKTSRKFQDRTYAKQGWFDLDENLSDSNEADYWEDAYVDTGDDDYWFGVNGDDAAATT